ncbi:MAG: M15 family metallopeptidase [Erysipelotrichaceae bacterium]|nr:M15 family metallopeptidase [Erysipelotrichaceae bacterium]
MNAIKRKMVLIIMMLLLISGSVLYIGFDTFFIQSPKKIHIEIVKDGTSSKTDVGLGFGVVEAEEMDEALLNFTPNPHQVDVESDSSIYKLVNRDLSVDASYVPGVLIKPNVPMSDNQFLREEAAKALVEMFDAALEDHIELKLVSGYRSYDEQVVLYNYYLSNKGKEYTDTMDCLPGKSEHQLGLAVDLGSADSVCELSSCFFGTSTYEWLDYHAYEYGFILRYPYDKEEITGVSFSPWHFRYVGKEEALIIHNTGLTLEEYYGY